MGVCRLQSPRSDLSNGKWENWLFLSWVFLPSPLHPSALDQDPLLPQAAEELQTSCCFTGLLSPSRGPSGMENSKWWTRFHLNLAPQRALQHVYHSDWSSEFSLHHQGADSSQSSNWKMRGSAALDFLRQNQRLKNVQGVGTAFFFFVIYNLSVLQKIKLISRISLVRFWCDRQNHVWYEDVHKCHCMTWSNISFTDWCTVQVWCTLSSRGWKWKPERL